MPDKSPLEIIREQIKKLLAQREQFAKRMDDVIAKVEARGGTWAPSKAEEAAFNTARDGAARITRELEPLEEQREAMLDAQYARDAADEASRRYGGSNRPIPVRVTGEPGPYRRDGQHGFFDDVVRAELGDYRARDRIEAYRRGSEQVEQRSIDSGALGGLVPPQFLTDMFAEKDRPGRAFLDQVRQLNLPGEGMTLTVPLSATATVVGSQASENTSVTSSSPTTVDLTVPVVTVAGQVDVSRQALDRGHMTDELIFSDLVGAYEAELERQAIEGTGGSGQHVGILSVTTPSSITSVTVSSSSMLNLAPKVADAIQRINGSRFGGPSVIVMHPRRWGALSSVTDTTGRPLFGSMGDGQNSIAAGTAAGVGVVGRYLGVPVLTSGNIPVDLGSATNEDRIIVTRASDLLLWEETGSPFQVRFDETLAGQLTGKLVIWGYSGFTAAWRTTATAILSGSGLTRPSF